MMRAAKTYGSVLDRVVFCTAWGRVRRPRARGDQGIAPTPKSYIRWISILCDFEQREPYLQRREHLSLFLTVDEVVVVLHGNERGQLVIDSIV